MDTNLSQRSGSAWKWWICAVLFLATVLNYLDRQTMSICGVKICAEFELSDEQFGQLLSAFRWTYAFMQIPAGYLADRFSIRMVYGLAVGFWSVAGAATAFAIGPRMLAWTRAFLGAGESFNWPCALRVTANMLPPKDRALANGVFTSGSAVGALIAPLIITPMAYYWGWRVAFFLVGALGAGWLLIWWAATRRPGALVGDVTCGADLEGDRVGSSLRGQLTEAISHPGFWLLMIVSATMNPCRFW